jgi:hypothetical protein
MRSIREKVPFSWDNGVRKTNGLRAKGTCQVKRFARKNKRQKDPRIVLGAPEGRITPRAGLHLVAKLDRLLSIGRTISQTAPSVKRRRRGLSLGEVVVSLAEMIEPPRVGRTPRTSLSGGGCSYGKGTDDSPVHG